MRVMSFNVLCGGQGERGYIARSGLVTKRIKEINPDTFGVQEAYKNWMNILCKNLPEYGYVGVGRDDGADEGEFSPVFYKKDMFEPVESGTFWLSETPDVPSKGWDGVCIRICTWCILKDKSTGREFAQLNTHLDHRGVTARIKGIRLVIDKIKEFDMPVICTGDFNTDEGSEPYTEMTSGIMGDAKYLAKKTVSGNTFTGFDKEATKDDSPIDFIFVKRDAVRAEEYKIATDDIEGRQPSDHYAVYADIEIV